MAEVLTDLEHRVLDYLIDYLRTNTYQPSIREIGRTFNIKSTKTVSELLQSLADKGWVERDPSRSRGVKLLGIELHTQSISVPMQHARSEAHPDVDNLELDRRIASRSTFLIVMPDDSLGATGIHRGDMLLVEPAALDQLEANDVVFATANEAHIVARFSDVRNKRDAQVNGRVISVVRRLRAPSAIAQVTVS